MVKLFSPRRSSALAVWLCAGLSLSFYASLPGESQTSSGLPTWLLIPAPAPTLLQPAIWTGRTAYRTGETARDFVFFSINQPAYLSIIHIEASGVVRLLLPNQAQLDNFYLPGSHRLAQPVEISRQEGTHYLQIIATPVPVALAKDFPELYPQLGTSAEAVKRQILAQLAARPLVHGEWGASWARYATAPAAPASSNPFAQWTIRAVDGDCRTGAEVRDASVFLDGAKTPLPAFVPLTVLRGDHALRVEAIGYRPTDARVRSTGSPTQDVCINLRPSEFIRGQAFFTYTPAPRVYDHVIFDATRSRAHLYKWDFGDGSPLAAGERVGHTFAYVGTFNVKLSVQFFDGESEVTVLPVQVRPSEPCALPSARPACQGGSREADSLTLEARAPGHVHLLWSETVLTGRETRLNFQVLFEEFPRPTAAQTVSIKIESYAQVELFDRSGLRLDAVRLYTANTEATAGLGPVPGQSLALSVLLRDLFSTTNLAKAGRLRVSAVLNVQSLPSSMSVRVRYRQLKLQ
jgi:hypothetical protein